VALISVRRDGGAKKKNIFNKRAAVWCMRQIWGVPVALAMTTATAVAGKTMTQ